MSRPLMSCQCCGVQFPRQSNKQNVCSAECRLQFYRTKSEGCWAWAGPKTAQGYGVLFLNTNKENGRRQVTTAHRFAYRQAFGDIPEGLCVMHTCDNPECTNPSHLMLGTWDDNNKDRAKKGRSAKKPYTESDLARYSEMNRGEKNNGAKLTEQQAIEILHGYKGMKHADVAVLYGVSRACIKSIKIRKTWAYL